MKWSAIILVGVLMLSAFIPMAGAERWYDATNDYVDVETTPTYSESKGFGRSTSWDAETAILENVSKQKEIDVPDRWKVKTELGIYMDLKSVQARKTNDYIDTSVDISGGETDTQSISEVGASVNGYINVTSVDSNIYEDFVLADNFADETSLSNNVSVNANNITATGNEAYWISSAYYEVTVDGHNLRRIIDSYVSSGENYTVYIRDDVDNSWIELSAWTGEISRFQLKVELDYGTYNDISTVSDDVYLSGDTTDTTTFDEGVSGGSNVTGYVNVTSVDSGIYDNFVITDNFVANTSASNNVSINSNNLTATSYDAYWESIAYFSKTVDSHELRRIIDSYVDSGTGYTIYLREDTSDSWTEISAWSGELKRFQLRIELNYGEYTEQTTIDDTVHISGGSTDTTTFDEGISGGSNVTGYVNVTAVDSDIYDKFTMTDGFVANTSASNNVSINSNNLTATGKNAYWISEAYFNLTIDSHNMRRIIDTWVVEGNDYTVYIRQNTTNAWTELSNWTGKIPKFQLKVELTYAEAQIKPYGNTAVSVYQDGEFYMFNQTGATEWQKSDSDSSEVTAVRYLPDGGLVVGNRDGWVREYDSVGNYEWGKQPTGTTDAVQSLAVNKAGEVFAGFANGEGLVKHNRSNGNQMWWASGEFGGTIRHLEWNNGYIYGVERYNDGYDQVFKFSDDASTEDTFNLGFAPRGFAVDENGNCYIGDNSGNVRLYNFANDDFSWSETIDDGWEVTNIDADEDYLYFAFQETGYWFKYDKGDDTSLGSKQWRYYGLSTDDGYAGVSVDPNGVVACGGDGMAWLDPEGNELYTASTVGTVNHVDTAPYDYSVNPSAYTSVSTPSDTIGKLKSLNISWQDTVDFSVDGDIVTGKGVGYSYTVSQTNVTTLDIYNYYGGADFTKDLTVATLKESTGVFKSLDIAWKDTVDFSVNGDIVTAKSAGYSYSVSKTNVTTLDIYNYYGGADFSKDFTVETERPFAGVFKSLDIAWKDTVDFSVNGNTVTAKSAGYSYPVSETNITELDIYNYYGGAQFSKELTIEYPLLTDGDVAPIPINVTAKDGTGSILGEKTVNVAYGEPVNTTIEGVNYTNVKTIETEVNTSGYVDSSLQLDFSGDTMEFFFLVVFYYETASSEYFNFVDSATFWAIFISLMVTTALGVVTRNADVCAFTFVGLIGIMFAIGFVHSFVLYVTLFSFALLYVIRVRSARW